MERVATNKNIKHSVHSTVQDLLHRGVEWDYNVSFREGINPEVHTMIINRVMSHFPTEDPSNIVKACKSYFMTRKTRAKRIQTNRVEEARKKQRKRQRMTNNRVRRLSVLNSMSSGITMSDRRKLEEALSTTVYISSQESESDTEDREGPKCLVVRKLGWRSEFLDHWFYRLEADQVKSDRCLTRRETSEESRRQPPEGAPDWAVKSVKLKGRK